MIRTITFDERDILDMIEAKISQMGLKITSACGEDGEELNSVVVVTVESIDEDEET